MEKKFDYKMFQEMFPNHRYRYLDTTGNGRPPIQSRVESYDKSHNETMGYDAYFTVNGFDINDHTISGLTNLNAIYVDIDDRKDPNELEEIKKFLTPTLIVETGRGYHIYWCFDEPIDIEKDNEESEKIKERYTMLQNNVVTHLKGDKNAKDIARIMRFPGSYYWKKSMDAYKDGVEKATHKTSIVYSNIAATYTLDTLEEAFPKVHTQEEKTMIQQTGVFSQDILSAQEKTKAEKQDWTSRLDKIYPMDDRPSFKRLLSGHPEALPSPDTSRNLTLLILASLCKRAGWTVERTYQHIINNTDGWYGMVAERGGKTEIRTTIESAFKTGYTYTKNNPIIAHNMTDEEHKKIEDAFAQITKDRREIDKLRFSTYELEVFAKHPYIKKNGSGIFYQYTDGYYKLLTQHDIRKIVLDSMYEDMMWGYRTISFVDTKIMCLRAIVPLAIETVIPNVINVQNGLLNMDTLELKAHTPDHVSFYQISVDYDKDAKCPTWDKCMDDWMAGDESEEKKLLLQNYVGYILSNTMKYHSSLFIVGDGINGKSTFADTVAMLVGEQATSHVSLTDLHKDFGLAEIFGKKLNVVEEIAGNKIFDSDIMKKVFSGEPVQANIKHQPMFQFLPQCKFIFSVNEVPKVNDTSMGTERRMITVQFGNDFKGVKEDTGLRYKGGKLWNELAGILNWAIEGYKILEQNKGFIKTREHTATMQSYREENSSVDGFLAECFYEEIDSELIEKTEYTIDTLYKVYVEYTKTDGRIAKKKQTLTKELKALAKRTKKFEFVERQHGRDTARIRGLKMYDEYESMIGNTFDTFTRKPTYKQDF